jgi:transcriptional regulator with XRE-family HTH domain/tetratricopeptide (TPR) repeat protein
MATKTENEDTQRYPNDLRYCIKQQGYTIKEVADRAGIAQRTMSDYLTGERPIPREPLKKIARILRCSIHEIIPEPDLVPRNQRMGASRVNAQKQRREQIIAPPGSHEMVRLTNAPDWFDIGVLAFTLAAQQHGWSTEEMHMRFEETKRSILEMTEQHADEKPLSRRRALILLSGLPVALMSLTMEGSDVPLFAEELLPLCATSIPACWELYHDGDHAEVERVLPTYCTRLAALARQASPYQQQAANFASQAYQLSCQMLKEREDFGAALVHCQEALTYARLAGDVNLQVAVLIRKADVYFQKCYPSYSPQAHQAFTEAQSLLKHATPLLQGRVYASLAESSASRKQEQEALSFMGLAQEVYPADPKNDPAFAYTGHSHYSLYLYGEGLTYLRLGQPAKAQQALARLEALLPKTLGVRQAVLQVRQAEVAVAAGNLEQSCSCLRSGVESVQRLGSSLFRSQAFEVYQGMPPAWHREKPVKKLAELFQV